jgi:HEPN domain-containing protein
MSSRSQAFFDEATKKLDFAKEELFKPEEDIVRYSVCKNAQYAVENFLKGFLIQNEVDIELDDTLDKLYRKCLDIDAQFAEIDLHAITCRSHAIDTRYCAELDKVTGCFDTADQLDTLLRRKKVI